MNVFEQMEVSFLTVKLGIYSKISNTLHFLIQNFDTLVALRSFLNTSEFLKVSLIERKSTVSLQKFNV